MWYLDTVKVKDDEQYILVKDFDMIYYHSHMAVLQIMRVGKNKLCHVCFIPMVGQIEGY